MTNRLRFRPMGYKKRPNAGGRHPLSPTESTSRVQVFLPEGLRDKLEALRKEADEKAIEKVSLSAYCRHVLENYVKAKW